MLTSTGGHTMTPTLSPNHTAQPMSNVETGQPILVQGYSTWTPDRIADWVLADKDISEIDGDFVLAMNRSGQDLLVSSFLAAMPYYYAVGKGGTLVHGDNVFEVARRAQIPWKWNERTALSLALYGHSLNEDTLCEGVWRILPAVKVQIRDGRRVLEHLKVRPFVWDGPGEEEGAFARLQRAFDGCLAQEQAVHLSLSAGYDSRLLLALCLDRGITPQVSVMGYADSTDVLVAQDLCKAVGLPLEVMELDADDYLRLGGQIANATSGVKTAINWHTYLYSQSKDFSEGIHLVGSNGEFARTFFFDKPALNPVTAVSPALGMNVYWFARLTRRRAKFSSRNPLLARSPLGPVDLSAQAHLSGHWSAKRTLPALDAFYAEQRVRHFIGAGLACYRTTGRPRSPFLDALWMRAVAATPRPVRQQSRFHANSTKALVPVLAGFKYNQLSNGRSGSAYHPFAALSRRPDVTDLLIESPHLNTWATRAERMAVLQDAQCNQDEERNLWLTLHFAGEALASATAVSASQPSQGAQQVG